MATELASHSPLPMPIRVRLVLLATIAILSMAIGTWLVISRLNETRISVERVDEREQLDRLGAGAEDGQDLASGCHAARINHETLRAA